MTGFFIFVHIVCCLFLMLVILMQSGRGGGLTEGFASAESMFGAKTNEFMVRTTIALASIYLVTNLTLAYISSRKEKSLIPDNIVTQKLPDVVIPVNAVEAPPSAVISNQEIPAAK